MLDLMGSGYMIDYSINSLNRQRQRENYEQYVAEALSRIVGVYYKGFPHYWDMIHPRKEDERTGTEIAEDIIARHGLKVVG